MTLAPLSVAVDRNELVIRIGVNTLAHAAVASDWATPYDDEENDFIRTFAIADPLQFAKDVAHALRDEREDGSSLLTDVLDKAAQEAINQGSEGIDDREHRIPYGTHASIEAGWAAASNEEGGPR